MTVAFVDDEQDARDLLNSIFHEYFPQHAVLWEADSVASARLKLLHSVPDILFLDINLKDGNGFDILDTWTERNNTAIVFITAYDEFALKAFRYHAFNYILKPLDPDLLTDVVNMVDQNQSKTAHGILEIQSLVQTLKKKKIEKIMLPSEDAFTVIEVADILRIEAEGNYTQVVMANNEKHVSTLAMKDFEEDLPQDFFFRIHKKHLVNSKHIKKVLRTDNGYLIMSNDEKIEIARRKKMEFLNWFIQNK